MLPGWDVGALKISEATDLTAQCLLLDPAQPVGLLSHSF